MPMKINHTDFLVPAMKPILLICGGENKLIHQPIHHCVHKQHDKSYSEQKVYP